MSNAVNSRSDLLLLSAGGSMLTPTVKFAPTEHRMLRLQCRPEAFRMWNAAMREVVEPGLFDIMAGPNSADLKTVTLEIA